MLCNTDPAPRKRKKPARYEGGDDDDFGSENEPPKSLPKLGGSSLLAKAQLNGLQSSDKLEIGRRSSGLSTSQNPDSSEASLTPLGESNLNRLNMQIAAIPAAPTSAPAKLTQELSTPLGTSIEQVPAEIAWNRPEGIGLPGQLKSLVLVNFMCHEHLKMNFCPNVNFISGQNGSGKSAILQAIQQVLGVKARDTGRATSQASFIKSGCPDAVITITLWNQGPEAFQPQLFGNEIIIERRIGRSASFCIKSAKGKKLGHKREDLDIILEALSINAANPIAVMTQDTTRSFMDGGAGKRDRQKYEIYMEATALARIDDANNRSSVQLAGMHAEVDSEKEKHDLLMKQQKGVESSLELLDQLDAAKAEEVELQQALSWASVLSTRADVERYAFQINERGPQLREQAQTDLEESKSSHTYLEAENASKMNSVETFDDERDKLSTEALHASDGLARANTAQRKIGATLREIQRKAKKARDDHEALLKATVEANQEIMTGKQEILDKNKEDLDGVAAAMQLTSSKLMECGAAAAEHIKVQKQLYEKKNDLQRTRTFLRRTIGPKEEEIKKAEKAVTDSLSQFNPKAIQLLSLISKHRSQFQKVPIGPLGKFLVLKDPRYAKVMEHCIGTHYGTFIVHSHQDFLVLKKACRAAKLWVPKIVITSHDIPLHNPEQNMPPNEVDTLYNVIGCSNEQFKAPILNFLIDASRIEQQAISGRRNLDEMKRIAHMRNVDCVWSPDAWCLKATNRNSQTLFPPKFKQCRIGGGKDDARAHLQQLKTQLVEMKAEQEANAHLLKETEEEHENHHNQYLALQFKKNKLLDEKDDLEGTQLNLEAVRQETESQMAEMASQSANSNFAQDLENASAIMRALESDAKEKQGAANEAAEALKTALQKQEEVKKRIEMMEAQQQTDIANNENRLKAIQEASEKILAMEDYCELLEAKLQATEEAWNEAEKTLESNIEQAAQICEEEVGVAALDKIRADLIAKGVKEENLSAKELPLLLSKKLDRLQSRIRGQENQAGGHRMDIEAKLRRIRRKTAASQRSLDGLTSAYTLLKAGFEWRKAQFERMDRIVEETVNIRFNKYLNRKGHNGSISVVRSQNERTGQEDNALEIKVVIDGNATQGRVKDLKQLSGGERSFTTVAFALALAEYTGCPFRAMDEFDVFMDAVNRQVSLESLLSNALEQKDLQFLFLTPLDISAVEGAKVQMRKRGTEIKDSFIKIVCMPSARSAPISIQQS